MSRKFEASSSSVPHLRIWDTVAITASFAVKTSATIQLGDPITERRQ